MNPIGSANGMVKLSLAQPIPTYTFADTSFSFILVLLDQYDQPMSIPHDTLPLRVHLVDACDPRCIADELMTIENNAPLTLNASGQCEITLRIARRVGYLSINERARRFCVSAEAIGRDHITPVLSDPITVVQHRLQLYDNPANPAPQMWFKDEGGRENCIEMRVQLLDRQGREVSNRRVKLRLSLLYENFNRVQNQEILRISPDSKLSVDEHGMALIRFRIEEVSKNHQKQGFRIQVEPDLVENPSLGDVSLDVSQPITVYSKRIKKKPKMPRKDDTIVTPPFIAVPTNQVSHKESLSTENSKSDLPKGIKLEETISELLDKASLSQKKQLDELDVAERADNKSEERTELYDSLKSVIQWTGAVVSGLSLMQWQQIGFELKSDGSSDYSRPLYRMQNPNGTIDSIIRQYSGDTVQRLLYLLRGIEDGTIKNEPTDSRLEEYSSTEEVDDARPNKRGRSILDSKDSSSENSTELFSPLIGEKGKRGVNTNKIPSPVGILTRSSGSWGLTSSKNSPDSMQSNFSNQRMPSFRTLNPWNPQLQIGLVSMDENEEGSLSPSNTEMPLIESKNSFLMPNIENQNSCTWDSAIGNGFPMMPLISKKSLQYLFEDKSIRDGSLLVPNEESRVKYVLAKKFNSERLGVLGMPAYDSSKILIGFYQEIEVHGRVTRLVLVTVDQVIDLQDHEQQSASRVLEIEQARQSNSVFELSQYQNLEKMKEAAGVYFWKKLSCSNVDKIA